MARRYGGQAAGTNAKRQWLCAFCCNVHDRKVKECSRCGAGKIEYFQSKKELARWLELLTLEKAGEISELRRQITFAFETEKDAIKTPTGRVMKHTVDFQWRENGKDVLEDVKGIDTDLGHLKRELVRIMYGHEIKLY